MSEEIKTCPFCGGKAEIDTSEEFATFVECIECQNRTFGSYGYKEREEVIEAWNRRTPTAIDREKLAELLHTVYCGRVLDLLIDYKDLPNCDLKYYREQADQIIEMMRCA